MRKCSLVLLISFFVISCLNRDNKKVGKSYPNIVDSLNAQDLFDKTKWFLYCIYCDEALEFNDDIEPDTIVTFGECSLMSDTIVVEKNTISMLFMFYYKDTIPCYYQLIKNDFMRGAVYRTESDSLIGFVDPNLSMGSTYSVICDSPNCKSRFVNPLQPEVVDYIKKNKNKIDPWFRKEAIKRGVIKE